MAAQTYIVSGLTAGTAYQFRVRAVNATGAGQPDTTERAVYPGTKPLAPGNLNARPDYDRASGNAEIILSWASGGGGGSPINKWEYKSATTPGGLGGATWVPICDNTSNRAPDCASTTSVNLKTLANGTTRLTNGTSCTFRVRAVNAIDPGAPAQANPATPGNAPYAPARALANPGDGQVTITVDAPQARAGSTVVGYQVRKRQGDGPYDAWEALGTTGANPSAEDGEVVSGLINGASYTFQVRAVSAFGPGPETTSNTVTPVGAPTAGMLGADPGDGQVTLSWTSGSSGGSAITKWQYRQSESGSGYGAWTDIADSGPATTSHTVTGLSNGTTYSFQVRAVNQQGNAVPITSGAVIPGTVPVAPSSVMAARGNGQVDLSWTAGTSDEAGPTTGWQVRTDDGDWMDVSGADTSSYSVTGLDNGTAYTFEVRAVNSFGAGEAGSDSATPATSPSAPEVSAERGDGSSTVSWTAGDDGGSAVTGWQVQVNDGGWTDVAADSMSEPVDTDDGAAYTFNSADFARELASACRGLTGADYGDDANDLANDACA